MKTAFTGILAVSILAACANVGNPNLQSPSAIYTTHFDGAQPSQKDVTVCAEVGQHMFWIVRDSSRAEASDVIAGKYYEQCLRERGYNPVTPGLFAK